MLDLITCINTYYPTQMKCIKKYELFNTSCLNTPAIQLLFPWR